MTIIQFRLLCIATGAALALAVNGCANQPPGQTVYDVEQGGTVLDKAASAYVALPACPTGAPLCSDAAIIAKIKTAEDNAHTAVVAWRKNPTQSNEQTALQLLGVVATTIPAIVPAK